jgi:hypothetical protein
MHDVLLHEAHFGTDQLQTGYHVLYQCYLLAVIIILVLRVRIRDILEIPVEK